VYNREFSVADLLRVQIESYLKGRISALFEATANPLLEDLSSALKTFSVVAETAQLALSTLNVDFLSVLRDFLFTNFCPTSLPPPGAPVPVAVSEPKDGTFVPIIWIIARRISSLVEQMTMSRSEYQWIPSLKMISKKHRHPHSHDDFKILCSFIGPQGVRVINYRLGRFIADKVMP
jgi:hypothetical protein